MIYIYDFNPHHRRPRPKNFEDDSKIINLSQDYQPVFQIIIRNDGIKPIETAKDGPKKKTWNKTRTWNAT